MIVQNNTDAPGAKKMNRAIFYIVLLSQLLLFSVSAQTTEKFSNRPWAEVKKAGKGSVTIFWNETPPFISTGSNGAFEGIEYELILGFKDFVKQAHQVDLELIWKKQSEFNETFKHILNKDELASIGASGFSLTAERQFEIGFSPPYMADISVMISSEAVPVATSVDDFLKISSHLTAFTIKKSTSEEDLLALKATGNLSYPINYVIGAKQIIDQIKNRNNGVGIIDLPIYLDMIRSNPAIKVKRQQLFTKIRKGFGLVYPLGSDWGEPLAEYFHQENFKSNFQKIIGRYINPDDYNLIEGLPDSDFQIALLTREKEIQQQHINEEIRLRNMGIILLALTGLSIVIITILYRRSRRLYKEIEQQRKNIEQKTGELELKNKKLEEFTFTNAHKLRAPVATILGLLQLYKYRDVQDNSKSQIIELLKQSSINLDREVKAIRSRLAQER